MQHIASISYGKDSLAMLEAIKLLGWPLDRIVTAEVWATDTIPADLPPMQEFKAKADEIIKERYGIDVEHFRSKNTYQSVFYRTVGDRSCKQRKEREQKAKERGKPFSVEKLIYGFPLQQGAWCNSYLKMDAIRLSRKSCGKDFVDYVGIAADEPKRIERHTDKQNVKMPLVEIGWDEAHCRKWCEENGLLSPIYTDSARGGCWFCHNQGVDQLRKLRHGYPKYWEMLLLWDDDSQITFHADGHTVHDFDRRFQAEDDGLIYPDERFRWADLEQPQLRWF